MAAGTYRVVAANVAQRHRHRVHPQPVPPRPPADVPAETADAGMSPVLLVGRMSVPDELDAKFNEAYNNERLPLCLSIPGYIRARRWEAVMGSPKYATVHEMESLEVSESEGWENWRTAVTPVWTHEVRPTWFTKAARRGCTGASSRSSQEPCIGRSQSVAGAGFTPALSHCQNY